MATARDDVELLTVAEVAQRLRVHRSTVWKLVRSNRLPAVHLSPRITRIPRVAVESFVREASGKKQVPAIEDRPAVGTEDPVVARLRRFSEELLAKRGGRPFSDSTEFLRQIREQRAKR